MKVRAKFNNITRQSGGIVAVYGSLVDKDGNVIPNTNVTISGPKDLKLDTQIDVDVIYNVTVAVDPTPEKA